MNVLIGFEESGRVRRAFRGRGHNAWSCDLMPARDNSPYHIQGDITEALKQKWDLIILHPPCTALSLSGNAHYGRGMPKHDLRLAAIAFTKKVWEAAKNAANKVALENPASVIFKELDAPTQYIQPWQFGHAEQKRTGLSLYNLPPLQPTDDVKETIKHLPRHLKEKMHYMSPSKNRARDRSITYLGIADAMAEQWGNYRLSEKHYRSSES